MKINNNIYTPYKYSYKHKKQPVKYDILSFKSRDLLSLQEKDVLEKVRESIVPENFLGQGTEAEVYRIKNSDYCVRIPYLSNTISKFKFSKELSPIDKVNHIVAKLGFGASIMKYFDGVIPKWYMYNNSKRYKLQEQIAGMPLDSYSGLLHQIAEAIDNEMLFDFSPGNLIVDLENKKLTAIDFYNMSENPKSIKPMSEMYSILTCYGSLEQTGKKIFDNIIDAGLEEFKPNKIPCMDVALFDFLELCLKRMGDAHTPESEKIKREIMYCADSLKKIKKQEILDKSASKLLEQSICNLKNIIQKVH